MVHVSTQEPAVPPEPPLLTLAHSLAAQVTVKTAFKVGNVIDVTLDSLNLEMRLILNVYQSIVINYVISAISSAVQLVNILW